MKGMRYAGSIIDIVGNPGIGVARLVYFTRTARSNSAPQPSRSSDV